VKLCTELVHKHTYTFYMQIYLCLKLQNGDRAKSDVRIYLGSLTYSESAQKCITKMYRVRQKYLPVFKVNKEGIVCAIQSFISQSERTMFTIFK
jgi:hypothetical protein